MSDQAASLRQWAAQRQDQSQDQQQAVSEQVSPSNESQFNGQQVVVLGLPSLHEQHALAALEVFQRWAAAGKKWVGDASQWRVIPVASDYPEMTRLVGTYQRWALWVNDDLDSFARAYRALKAMHQAGAPKQILALHQASLARRGLLANLQDVAKRYFNIELLVLSS
ncbi:MULTISPECIES: hypothetical protein [Idiomarina]|uniref:hypothetical protein n=1 Tax=Idiomarina TaxID=135575 RepID=UPI00129CA685|nr:MULTISPECIES: hypothetical protein [Idiomarina]MRJ42125.1 hypothetical protein [Idiomarina sp. FeN1]NCU57050.1 hypothetical protein [Idiomarina sp. FenA--70]NCU59759.1 hypothetical protein [Idiomarina sp. FenBw--71]UUN13249.1 hypothetical protein KGF88_11535 [Idiomarina loihiensis]